MIFRYVSLVVLPPPDAMPCSVARYAVYYLITFTPPDAL